MTHRSEPHRSIDTILERQQRRFESGQRVFPPDFLHGTFRLDELYEVFGEDWVERAAFVTRTAKGAAVAYFDDYFLTIEYVEDHADVGQWLSEHLEERRAVVELVLDGEKSLKQGWIDIRCTRARLRELELEHLRITRDFEAASGQVCAQTDLLSLIGLCARLGVERLH